MASYVSPMQITSQPPYPIPNKDVHLCMDIGLDSMGCCHRYHEVTSINGICASIFQYSQRKTQDTLIRVRFLYTDS